MSANEKTTITQIVLPIQFDLDTLEAVRLLRLADGNGFTGLKTAGVMFTESAEPKTDAQMDAAGMLPVNCRGTRFDAAGRRDDSAIARVMAHIDIKPTVALTEMSKLALQHGSATSLNALTRLAAKYRQNERSASVHWITTCLTAVHVRIEHAVASVDKELTAIQLLEAALKKDMFSGQEERVRKGVEKLITASFQQRRGSAFELGSMMESLQRNRVTCEKLGQMFEFALELLFAQQKDFWAAVDECSTRGMWYWVRTGTEQRELFVPVLFIRSDADELPDAARLPEALPEGPFRNAADMEREEKVARRRPRVFDTHAAVIVIYRPTSDRYAITMNGDFNFSLANASRMLRWHELPKLADKTTIVKSVQLDWHAELGARGQIPTLPHWNYTHDGKRQWLVTDRAISPTFHGVIEVIRRALHERLVCEWMKERKIA